MFLWFPRFFSFLHHPKFCWCLTVCAGVYDLIFKDETVAPGLELHIIDVVLLPEDQPNITSCSLGNVSESYCLL